MIQWKMCLNALCLSHLENFCRFCVNAYWAKTYAKYALRLTRNSWIVSGLTYVKFASFLFCLSSIFQGFAPQPFAGIEKWKHIISVILSLINVTESHILIENEVSFEEVVLNAAERQKDKFCNLNLTVAKTLP